jgi:hypothetical protein
LKPLPYYSLVYPLAEEDLSDLAYFFYDESAGEVDRPGLKRLKTILDNWKVEFWTGKGPIILSHRDCGDYLEILDTREVALCRRVSLTGFKRQVYETCETAQSLKSLQRTFGEDSGELEVVLEELVAQKILLNLDSRYLALSVEGGLPALPARREYAGGIVLPEAEKVGR